MSEAERRLSALLHRAVPEPPNEVSVDSITRAARHRRAVRILAPIAASVAIIAVITAAYGVHLIGRHPAGVTTAGRSPTTSRPVVTSSTPRSGTAPTPVPGSASCPTVRLLPNGRSVIVDYVDFIYLHTHMYLGDYGKGNAVRKSDLGPRVATVGCTISRLTSDSRHEVVGPFRDGNAAFLPVGTSLYAVAGFSPECRVAALRGNRVIVYLAQHEVDKHTAALPCATMPTHSA